LEIPLKIPRSSAPEIKRKVSRLFRAWQGPFGAETCPQQDSFRALSRTFSSPGGFEECFGSRAAARDEQSVEMLVSASPCSTGRVAYLLVPPPFPEAETKCKPQLSHRPSRSSMVHEKSCTYSSPFGPEDSSDDIDKSTLRKRLKTLLLALLVVMAPQACFFFVVPCPTNGTR